MKRSPEPGIAAVLSLLLPGVGQFYSGHMLWGVFWLIITPGLWIGSGGLLGWICHILSAMQAHGQAQEQQRYSSSRG